MQLASHSKTFQIPGERYGSMKCTLWQSSFNFKTTKTFKTVILLPSQHKLNTPILYIFVFTNQRLKKTKRKSKEKA